MSHYHQGIKFTKKSGRATIRNVIIEDGQVIETNVPISGTQ
jgi:hypothetical protein